MERMTNNSFITKTFMTNSLLFHQLHNEMTERPFLKDNPVIKQTKKGMLNSDGLAEAIRQYVRFPEKIVKMLQGAALHFAKDHPVSVELERNWNQENGSATGGVPHVQILKAGLKRDLSIDADDVQASKATERFISTVLSGMKESSLFALGQAYALEASAVPELAILIGPALNAYADMVGKTQPIKKIALDENGSYVLPKIETEAQAYAMTMSDWFALHIVDFEVGHRDYLREKAILVLTGDTEQAEFARGYRNVLDAMDEWWMGLSKGE